MHCLLWRKYDSYIRIPCVFTKEMRCLAEFSFGVCCVQQVGTILMSSERPTPLDCLRDPGQRIQRDHVPTWIASSSALRTAENAATDESTKHHTATNALRQDTSRRQFLWINTCNPPFARGSALASVALRSGKWSTHIWRLIRLLWCISMTTKSVDQLHLLVFLLARASCHDFFFKSRCTRLYVYQSDLFDRRPICCNIIIRDSGSRQRE